MGETLKRNQQDQKTQDAKDVAHVHKMQTEMGILEESIRTIKTNGMDEATNVEMLKTMD